MNRYIVFYGGRSTTLFAATSFDAQQKGVAYFKVPPNRANTVSAHLVERDGKEVTQALS